MFFIFELQEILIFLENEEKRSDLIYSLKNAGEDSKQVHAFKEIITSFNLQKPPRGIDQTTLLQNSFQYCEPKECFENFRLVSTSWKYAIENMRFDAELDLEKIVEFEQNGKYPIFYTKYNLKGVLGNMSGENQDIWNQRILYLKSIGVELMSNEEYMLKITELRKESKWGFYFSG